MKPVGTKEVSPELNTQRNFQTKTGNKAGTQGKETKEGEVGTPQDTQKRK